MFNSMFIGLSGMNAYSNGLRQISNNITNLNSNGFRATTVGFSDLYSGNFNGLSYSGGDFSGGNGVELSERRLDFRQGELRQTDRDLDLAIEGNGFLVVERDGQYLYTRTGNFEVDNQGFIVLAGTDYKLSVLNEVGVPISLSLDAYRLSPPEQTTAIRFADNLSSTSTEFTLSDLTVYNANGAPDTWQVKFTRDETSLAGEWSVTVTNSAGGEVGSETLKFLNGIIDPTTSKLTFSDLEAGRTVEFDFSQNVTSFSSGEVSTLRSSDIDGYGIGDITSLEVNASGVLEIGYSNEQTVELGAVAIADFQNPQLLTAQSGGLFSYDRATGRDFRVSESNSVGRVLSRRVEASNVDLSQQFGDLILVQRGYQASSQIVSVSNDMIQQLFGIRGQG